MADKQAFQHYLRGYGMTRYRQAIEWIITHWASIVSVYRAVKGILRKGK